MRIIASTLVLASTLLLATKTVSGTVFNQPLSLVVEQQKDRNETIRMMLT